MSRSSRVVLLLAPALVIFSAACEPLPPLPARPGESTVAPAPAADVPIAHEETAAPAPTPSADPDSDPMLPPLQKEELAEGTGPEVKKGDRILVHYTGTLTDGTKFDSSLDRGTPFEFVVGEGSVIPGWELGVIGLKKGGKRKLTIPPHLGYGLRGSPPKIPPNATLVFVIELVDIEK